VPYDLLDKKEDIIISSIKMKTSVVYDDVQIAILPK